MCGLDLGVSNICVALASNMLPCHRTWRFMQVSPACKKLQPCQSRFFKRKKQTGKKREQKRGNAFLYDFFEKIYMRKNYREEYIVDLCLCIILFKEIKHYIKSGFWISLTFGLSLYTGMCGFDLEAGDLNVAFILPPCHPTCGH